MSNIFLRPDFLTILSYSFIPFNPYRFKLFANFPLFDDLVISSASKTHSTGTPKSDG